MTSFMIDSEGNVHEGGFVEATRKRYAALFTQPEPAKGEDTSEKAAEFASKEHNNVSDEKPKLSTLLISKIRTNGGTQPRAALDEAVVAEYAEAMQAGDFFPPVTVFYDGEHYWLADGYHRLEAERRNGQRAIEATVYRGNRRDAVLHSVGANAEHGLRRSNDDKRRAVETLLRDEEWVRWSDREIAKHCKVSHTTVGRIRSELEASGAIDQIAERTYERDGQAIVVDTTNIGKSQPKKKLNMHEQVGDHRIDADGPRLRHDGSDTAYECVWKVRTEAGGWAHREHEWFDDIEEAMRWFATAFEEAKQAIAEAARQAEAAMTFEVGDRVMHIETGEIGTIKSFVPLPGSSVRRAYVAWWDDNGQAKSRVTPFDQLKKVEQDKPAPSAAEPEEPKREWPPAWLKAYRQAAYTPAEPGKPYVSRIVLVRLGGILVALEGQANKLAAALGADVQKIPRLKFGWYEAKYEGTELDALKLSVVDQDKLPDNCHIIHVEEDTGELKMAADQQLETLDVTALLKAKEEAETAREEAGQPPAWLDEEAPAETPAEPATQSSKSTAEIVITPAALADMLANVQQGIALLSEESVDEVERAVYRAIAGSLPFWSTVRLQAVLDGLSRPGVREDVRRALESVDLDDDLAVNRALRDTFTKLHTQSLPAPSAPRKPFGNVKGEILRLHMQGGPDGEAANA